MEIWITNPSTYTIFRCPEGEAYAAGYADRYPHMIVFFAELVEADI